MELKDYTEKYGKKVVSKVLTKLESDKKHVTKTELIKLLENEKANRKRIH